MSNCLIFAFVQWLHYGGYVIVRKSRHGWWPHFMWVKDLNGLEVSEYSPPEVIAWANKCGIPPLVFRGQVRVGRDE
jgi:hypothetical protein